MQLDTLDEIAAKAYEGFLVRKDLVRQFKGQYAVPTYVAEFLLGRYCASVNEDEIKEGLAIVQRQLSTRTVRAGEEELFKARAKEQGRVKLIDLVKARLDAKNDCFLAELPSVRINDARIPDELVHAHDRMLTGGFYAEVDLAYDASIAAEKNGRPFGVESLREIQLSKSDVLESLCQGRPLFSFTEWRDLLLRSVGLEPSTLSERTRDVMLLRISQAALRSTRRSGHEAHGRLLRRRARRAAQGVDRVGQMSTIEPAERRPWPRAGHRCHAQSSE